MTRGRLGAWALALAAGVAAVAATACNRESRKEERMADVLGAGAVRQCVGRFCLMVPASMARSADTFKVQGLTLEEVAWEPGAKDPWEREWLARLAKVEALKERRESPADAFGDIVDQRLLVPGKLKAVLFYSRGHQEIVTWGAILDAGPSGLWLQADASPENGDEAARRIAEVASAYRVTEAGKEPPRGAFHLVRGVIAAPFKLAEEAHARFAGHPLKLDLSFTYETTFEPNTQGLMERFASALEKSGATVMGGGAIPIRNKKRKVAGLPGEELILHTSERGKGGLSFVWTTPGEEGSGKHPEIGIEMDSPDDGKKEEKIALWDALLDSVKPAP